MNLTNRMLWLSKARLLLSPPNFNSYSLFNKVPFINSLKTTETHHGWYCSNVQINKPLQDHLRVSSNRNRFSGFRTFCTIKDLQAKKCVPCSSKDMKPMIEEAAAKLVTEVPEWSLVHDGDTLKLNRTWKAKSFTKGLELFQLVANIAEAEGHHPDLHLTGWNNVKIEIWTHSVGGLTENDFILAAKINTLDLQHLLRRKSVAHNIKNN